ncbi:IS3 family transposase [Chryseobacterium sp. KCF3-3]|uniref:IS3 family transposase n=1 Tax=Chryseobacterium sp. KCF3-3 TaxID=3231511 RepID=UPI0009DFD69F
MNMFYRSIGVSKQAVHQQVKRQQEFDVKLAALIMDADELRREHPGCGVEKMYYTLKPNFIGRDNFIEIFMQLGYRLNIKKNYKRTTIASKIYFPNVIKGMKISSPSALWQSDLTYIPIEDKFYYAVFIIDVYTKKIVGFSVSDHMRASANLKALKMALKNNQPPKVHHSDRGSQYTSRDYIDLLKAHNSTISMGASAQENAYAERINRTIKNDYIQYWNPKNFEQLKRFIKKAVNHYNTKRPHNAIGKMSPEKFEEYWRQNMNINKPILNIFNNEILNNNTVNSS